MPDEDQLSKIRQPKPVKVTIDGEAEDVDYWIMRLQNAARSQGDDTQLKHGNIFMIFPRAVND